MSKPYPLLRAFRCAAIALVAAAILEGFRQIAVPGLSSWQSHLVAILACAAIVFLLTSVRFPIERSEPRQFSQPDQQLHHISGRRRAQAAMAESERRYRSLFENMLEGFAYCEMLFDDRGRPIDFVYLDVNRAFGKLTGLANVVGKRFTEVIPGGNPELFERYGREVLTGEPERFVVGKRFTEVIPGGNPELFERYGRVVLTGEPESFEIEIKALGMWFCISAHGAGKGCFVATFDNITERKRIEQI